MIEEKTYIKAVELYYSFLETEFGFIRVNVTVVGNAFYDIEYRDKEMLVSISYENMEDHLEVIVFLLQNGKMPTYNDKTKTLHLKHLNNLVLAKVKNEEIELNAKYFAKYKPQNVIEKKLLKEAKKLRICLKYFNYISIRTT